MKKVLIFNGSPRSAGNTSALVQHFVSGVKKNTDQIEILNIGELNLNYCCGCLRCNMIGRCGRPGDDWESIVLKMDEADVIVFASPIYFHHVTAQMKKLLDRFRSLVHVQITETDLIHTANKKWEKDLVLIFTMGSFNDQDAQPAIDMFQFMFSFLSPQKNIHILKGTRLAVTNQLDKTEDELLGLYKKMRIPEKLAAKDYQRNRELIKKCIETGENLSQ